MLQHNMLNIFYYIYNIFMIYLDIFYLAILFLFYTT